MGRYHPENTQCEHEESPFRAQQTALRRVVCPGQQRRHSSSQLLVAAHADWGRAGAQAHKVDSELNQILVPIWYTEVWLHSFARQSTPADHGQQTANASKVSLSSPKYGAVFTNSA